MNCCTTADGLEGRWWTPIGRFVQTKQFIIPAGEASDVSKRTKTVLDPSLTSLSKQRSLRKLLSEAKHCRDRGGSQ